MEVDEGLTLIEEVSTVADRPKVKGFKMTPRARRDLLKNLKGSLLHVLEYHWEWSNKNEISRRYVSQVCKGTGYSRNTVCACHTKLEEMGYLVLVSEPKRKPNGQFEDVPKEWKVVLVPDSGAQRSSEQVPKKKGSKRPHGEVRVQHTGSSPKYRFSGLTETVNTENQYTKPAYVSDGHVNRQTPIDVADGTSLSRSAPSGGMDVPSPTLSEKEREGSLGEQEKPLADILNVSDEIAPGEVMSPLEKQLTLTKRMEKYRAENFGRPWKIPARLTVPATKLDSPSLVAPPLAPSPVPPAPPPSVDPPTVTPAAVTPEATAEHDWVVCPEYKACPLCDPHVRLRKGEQEQVNALASILKNNMKMEKSIPESAGALSLLWILRNHGHEQYTVQEIIEWISAASNAPRSSIYNSKKLTTVLGMKKNWAWFVERYEHYVEESEYNAAAKDKAGTGHRNVLRWVEKKIRWAKKRGIK